MASDKDDHNDLDMGFDMDNENTNDIIDVEGVDAPLSAMPLGAADEYDDEGDDEFADESAQIQKPKKKSGGMTKMVAPLIVLLAAAGAGGYIVMNPAILGGTQPTQIASPMDVPADVTPPAADTAMLPPPDMPTEPVQEVAVNDVLPQPLANMNEVPQAPLDPAAVPDMPVTDTPPVPEITPEITPEVTADAPASDPAALALAAEENSAQVLMGSDVAVTPESMNLPASDIPVAEVVPEIAPEVVPEVVAEVPATPSENMPAEITEPTFVPAAPPEMPPVTEVSVADAAVPPVMNAEDPALMAAQDTIPRTITQPQVTNTPAAASGSATAEAAPGAPESVSNVYYDSLAQVPTGAMATSVGPREINPVLEPASKMIVVTKDKGEGTQEALLVSANRALKLHRYDAALEMFDQLYAKNKRDSRIMMGRAVAQQNMGLNESAIQSYEEVLALKPNSTEALVNMMGLVRKQYPEVALRRLIDLYGKHPNNAGIAAQIGITNAELGHFDDAMRYLGIASTLEPTNAQHLFNMAIAADRQGAAAQAIQLYERALEVDVMYGASRSVPRESIYDRLSVLRRG